MLNDTLDFDSEEEYRLTGTEKRPDEMVAVPMERAAMSVGWAKGEAGGLPTN